MEGSKSRGQECANIIQSGSRVEVRAELTSQIYTGDRYISNLSKRSGSGVRSLGSKLCEQL